MDNPPKVVVIPPKKDVTVLVCGGRNFADEKLMNATLDKLLHDLGQLYIVQGGAEGADKLALEWAHRQDRKKVRVATVIANWAAEGNAAGPNRNQRMLNYFKPGLVLAFPGGTGTADMVRRARQQGYLVNRINAL